MKMCLEYPCLTGQIDYESSLGRTSSFPVEPTFAQPEDCQTPSDWSLLLGMVVSMTVLVVGSCGNLLTVCTIAHQFHMPRRSRYIKDLTADTVLIINLSIADLFYSAISLPFMFTTYYRLYTFRGQAPWGDGDVACMVSAFLRYTNAIAEWTTLGLMALERCLTIYNFRTCRRPSRWFTPGKTALYCCLIWLLSMGCQLPTLTMNFGYFGYNAEFAKCDFNDNMRYQYFSPRVMFFALESMVPCILILIGYIVILVQVYSSSTRILAIFRSLAAQRTVALRRSRTTRLIVKLLFVYLVCVIPICLYNISMKPEGDNYKEIGIVIYCIYWLQYCINNFIYVVSNEKYRNAYCQFVSFLLCRTIPQEPLPGAERRNYGQRVYSISCSQSNLQAPTSSRIRTPSECEEAWQHQVREDYESQDDSPNGSFSSISRTGRLKELNGPHQQQEVDGSIPPAVRSHSISLSSTSSIETLVRPCGRLSRSVKQDLRAARHKLKRTFSY
ncbi:protein trapped in endoderm-1-like [Panulirus ornatus]|uniref:protein trapped in endoderm-1-like n=1 Tax=Panulirus ornatus TaxID=150431 RepID=UPI003A8B4310